MTRQAVGHPVNNQSSIEHGEQGVFEASMSFVASINVQI